MQGDFPRHRQTSLPQIRSQISQFKIEIEICRDILDGWLLSAYSQILSLFWVAIAVCTLSSLLLEFHGYWIFYSNIVPDMSSIKSCGII